MIKSLISFYQKKNGDRHHLVNPIYIAFESIPSMILSVLIPVKNMGESVFRSLKSAHINLQHSSFQYEIIISENASTDNTLKEIKRFLGDKSYGDKCQIRLIENSKDMRFIGLKYLD